MRQGRINVTEGMQTFSGGEGILHWCTTMGLTGLCLSLATVVGFDLVVSQTKLRLALVPLLRKEPTLFYFGDNRFYY